MATKRGRASGSLGWRVGSPLLLGMVGVACWQVLAARLPPMILPDPASVVTRLGIELATGDLVSRTAVTVWEALLGCALSVVIGLPIGTWVGLRRGADVAFAPYLAASQAIPAVALAPLLVIWIGYGLTPVALLCALLVFFPVVLATRLGLHGVDRRVIEAAELDGASAWSLYWRVQLPLAAPTIITGVRNGFTLSITGAVVGEMVMGGTGLGMTLSTYSASTDTTGLFATLVVLCLLAVAIYVALLGLQAVCDPLRPTRQERQS